MSKWCRGHWRRYLCTAPGMTGCMLPLHDHCMFCMCAANISSPPVGPQSVLVCLCMLVVVAAVCVCVCVFLQHPPSTNEATVKRHHSAPFWMSPRSSSQVSLDRWASWWLGRACLTEFPCSGRGLFLCVTPYDANHKMTIHKKFVSI